MQDIITPYGRLPQEEQAKGKFVAQIKAGLSAPTSTETYPKRYFVFSNFYTAAVTFPFTVSVAYWLVLQPLNTDLGRGGKGEVLHYFVLISITMLNSVIAFVEVMALSDMRKQKVLILSARRNSLNFLGSGHPSRRRHRHLLLICHMDSLWPLLHRRVCAQVL